jgi:glycosyltransferase involved in cell wall biosynthesis
MMQFSILIPSRLEGPKPGTLFLSAAVASIRAQKLPHPPQILVGIDAGVTPPPGLAEALGVTFVNSEGRSQAAALNAAASRIEGDHVALLEDDDTWNPDFLAIALKGLESFDFVSSTQLEILASNDIVRVNDFPTPSGWVMRREVWDQVGGFNPDYRWHLDNEWLGRLGQTGVRRLHVAETTAPIDITAARGVRPLLAAVAERGRPSVELMRHGSPWPLVIRLVHGGSGTQRIMADPQLGAQSRQEVEELKRRFGDVPH